MKRILLIMAVVAVLISVLAIPTFASDLGSYTAQYNSVGESYDFDIAPEPGIYDVYLYASDGSFSVGRNVEIVAENGTCNFILVCDEFGTTYSGFYMPSLPTLYGAAYIGDVLVEKMVFSPSPSGEQEPVDLTQSVSDALGNAVNWVKTFLHELVSADGQLHGLLPFVGIAVAITVIFVAIKIVHIFI